VWVSNEIFMRLLLLHGVCFKSLGWKRMSSKGFSGTTMTYQFAHDMCFFVTKTATLAAPTTDPWSARSMCRHRCLCPRSSTYGNPEVNSRQTCRCRSQVARKGKVGTHRS
jgi:hypothetical protein